MKHYLYTPFTGLGLYGGSRGKRWLKNRIQIFKQFVVPSLQAQTNQNFSLWVSWRPEDRGNKHIKELETYLKSLFGDKRVVFTYSGVCFWDDKYPDHEALPRLTTAIHGAMNDLINDIDSETVLMTIQPSDDCYWNGMVEEMQTLFSNTDYQALGYKHGYITSYQTGQVRYYNPKTNPPFFTIKFPQGTFIEPMKHVLYTGPYKSHEYVGDKLKYMQIDRRGFLVGTHGENISTHFNIPYAGDPVDKTVLASFGIMDAQPLHIRYSLRKHLMRKLPHRVQRKLRYIFGEKIYQKIYKFIHG